MDSGFHPDEIASRIVEQSRFAIGHDADRRRNPIVVPRTDTTLTVFTSAPAWKSSRFSAKRPRKID